MMDSLNLGAGLDLSSSDGPEIREGVGFWPRAAARIIDTVIHFGLGFVAGMVAVILVAIGSQIHGVPAEASLAKISVTTWVGFVTAMIGSIAMHALAEGIHGSTVGKRICGLTVISEDGSPATGLGALKRNVAYFWDSLFFGVIAHQRMAQSPRRQRYGDAWGHTQVVRLASLAPEQRRSWLRFALAAAVGIFVDCLLMFIEVASRLA